MAVLVLVHDASIDTAFANVMFFANLPPAKLMAGGEHLWSLCLDFQFYIFMALLVKVGSNRALLLIPIFTLGITFLRIYAGEVISIVTWHRVDEIFIGGCVALAWNNKVIGNFSCKIPALLAPCVFDYIVFGEPPPSRCVR